MTVGVKTNSAKFIREIDAAIVVLETTITLTLRGLAVEAFGQILQETPQATGNAVANWSFGMGFAVDNADSFFRDRADSMKPLERAEAMKIKGDREAIDRALSLNTGRDVLTANFEGIYITNSALGSEGEEYIQLLEDNPENFLRRDNRPGAMIKGAVGYINSTYSVISDRMAARLGRRRLSDL